MVPAAFRSLRVLRGLNIAGVGLSLAALASVVFGRLEGGIHHVALSALVTGFPTLLVGTWWAKLLRQRLASHRRGSWSRWGVSLPLAMLDASLIGGLWMASLKSQFLFDWLLSFVMGAVLGATLGAMVWLPSMLVALLLFGVPIAWSQKQAQQGLAGEERGEALIGVVVATLSLGAWVALLLPHRDAYGPSAQWLFLAPFGLCMAHLYSGAGWLVGVLSCLLAMSRERARRRIVRDAEAGKIHGLRVDTTEAGRVLVRVTAQGEGYRVTDLDEELFALDQQGRAVQAVPPRAEQSASR